MVLRRGPTILAFSADAKWRLSEWLKGFLHIFEKSVIIDKYWYYKHICTAPSCVKMHFHLSNQKQRSGNTK